MLRKSIVNTSTKQRYTNIVSGTRPGNWAILLETRSCAILLTTATVNPVMHCGLYGDCAISTEIAQYLLRLRNLRRYGRKKMFPLILDRGSQSYLSWFIVSLTKDVYKYVYRLLMTSISSATHDIT